LEKGNVQDRASTRTHNAFKSLANLIEEEMDAADDVQKKLENGEISLGATTDVETATQYTDAPAGTLETLETIETAVTAAAAE